MSYPFTKPQSRYGFRRSWNDPRTGLVGSGPGRPMRRYATDPEVGLPQLGPGLGATPETPVSEGIFNVGPAAGFTRGVFTPDPPYATPRYIAASPDGVSGLGAFGATVTCDKSLLINWIADQIMMVPPFNKLPNLEVCGLGVCAGINGPKEVKKLVRMGLNALGNVVLDGLIGAANQGMPALKAYVATSVAPRLANDVNKAIENTGIPKKLNMSFGISGAAMANIFNGMADSLMQFVKSCQGQTESAAFNPKAQYSSPKACEANGYKAVELKPGEWGYIPGQKRYKCLSATELMEAEMFKAPVDQTVDFNKSWYAAKDALEAGMSTRVADVAKCAQAGGQWYPGGADCLVDSSGALYSCQAPTAATHKRYFCVPPGTPGATAATPSALSASGKSNLPLILGAAAIAALLITRL